jgi:hypothetical protein
VGLVLGVNTGVLSTLKLDERKAVRIMSDANFNADPADESGASREMATGSSAAPTPARQGQIAVSADIAQAEAKIERGIKQRRTSDITLINY